MLAIYYTLLSLSFHLTVFLLVLLHTVVVYVRPFGTAYQQTGYCTLVLLLLIVYPLIIVQTLLIALGNSTSGRR